MPLELQPITELPDPRTGEVLPATPDNAATVRLAAAQIVAAMRDLQAACDEVLAEECRRQGTKTLHLDGHTVTLTGGTSTVYDPVELMENLRSVNCPEERINALVVETVTYKVNRSVLRQLMAANEDYEMACELASHEEEKSWRATIK